MLENRMVAERNRPEMPTVEPESNEARMEREQREARELKVAEYADGLRQLADFYEGHPDMPLPFPWLYIQAYEKAKFLGAVKTLSSGGKVTKEITRASDPDHAEYRCKRAFGPIELNVDIARKQVCRLVSPAVYDCPDSLLEEAAEYKGPSA